MESVEITDRAATQIARGYLWIFSNEVVKKPVGLKPGAWCQFLCRTKIIATGYANPHSLIFGRVAALGSRENVSGLIVERLAQSFARRSPLDTNAACRLVYSESDFLPGVVLDSYAGNLVLQSNTAGIDQVLDVLERLVPEIYEKTFGRQANGFIVKADSNIRQLERIKNFSKVVAGNEEKLKDVSFEESGTQFAANLLEGQKTGSFLDQRDNRKYIAKLAASKKESVLDLFCYAGGWGLHALRNGAAHVTFVDESAPALQLVEKGLELNGFAKSQARLVNEDVFSFLEKETGGFDVVVADPPAFVKSKKNLPQAVRAYEKLNRFAWRCVRENGVLITCSCSYHLSEEDFLHTLKIAVAKEKSFARVVYRGGQATDHPMLLSMPETRYLKCLALQKISL